MFNPFKENKSIARKFETEDSVLVSAAVAGDKKSLELLIKRHQAWIFNISLKMVWDPADAEDVTQEVLIKIITKLSTFRSESSFRTWAYRITANHVINMRKRKKEFEYTSFRIYGNQIVNSPDTELPDKDSVPVDVALLIEETKIGCMNAMLLCLDREQRLVFILGSLFGVNDTTGSEILGISRDNFRQKLARARKDLSNFMSNKCGLIDKKNPCHCNKKTKLMIDAGHVNPEKLLFTKNRLHSIESIAGKRKEAIDELMEKKAIKLFRDHPFQDSPDFVSALNQILECNDFKRIFNFN
ncbi:MAG TPA: RNA polymerase sigma factor [Ignavibacteria bacterium]|nr:RNA polymerase subunit sigma-70 [Bacteroidota bacterium]HRI84902.1 RNA polymerase sigma factor [Ignavibacteria bacterium]HRJ99465.1 RNA polymerase sigma factor [Ignavibacteria bacterium]HRK00053.1 RNA polymerase sigma factor [Ignavibacteria bacterium]